MKSDIEISEAHKLKKIVDIAKKYGINEDYLINYGKYMAKVDLEINNTLKDNKQGKLILVTSTNPTPYGEGKTTMSIGLTDALNRLNKKAIVCLREPSMGPVFGRKGGATGGGYAQVVPMDKINLHFTGDMHAITSANNLLCAIIDNHIFQGNELKIKDVLITRCLDVNDRALRKTDLDNRKESFCITVATELMAIFCLAKDFDDLRNRIDSMIVAYSEDRKAITPKDLNATDAMLILLKDAINPNIVQTLEENLAFVHGGPFANIAHGTSSLIGTNLALKLSDYVVTEAGFGSDLGAEKFFDIVSKQNNKFPDLVIVNATIRSLKYHGNNDLKEGLKNLGVHIENMQKLSSNVLVCINKFINDTKEDLDIVKDYVKQFNIKAITSTSFLDGGKGSIELANECLKVLENKNITNTIYDNDLTIKEKIEKVAKEIYRASSIEYSDEALNNIKLLEDLKLDNYPICISKTPMSLSDDEKLLNVPTNYTFHVRDVYINKGAKFITVMSGKILKMPGLAKNSAYENMTIDSNKIVRGLF